jgi:4-hydroxy-3-polyprenylbenzoate decarboxylase
MFLAYDDLRAWIGTLEKHGELKRIREKVSPELEITEITDRVSKIGSSSHPSSRERWKDGATENTGNRDQGSGTKDPSVSSSGRYAPGGPALLFENVKGHAGHKVLINQFGSERRMSLALGVERLDEIAERIHGLMNLKPPSGGFFDKLKMLPQLSELANVFPKTVGAKDAPAKEIIRKSKEAGGDGDFDLNFFPILKCWPHDAGRFITLPCVHTRDPRTGKRNVGMYRMQVFDGRTTGMHWQRQKVAAEHYRNALRIAAAQASSETPPTASVAMMAESAGGATAIPGSSVGGLPQVSLGAQKGSRLEVAVAIGTDPATTFSAVVPAPPEVESF